MVGKDGFWRIMTKYGCLEKFITVIRKFHDGTHAKEQDNGEISVAFPVTNRVKQGNVLPPLFSVLCFL